MYELVVLADLSSCSYTAVHVVHFAYDIDTNYGLFQTTCWTNFWIAQQI